MEKREVLEVLECSESNSCRVVVEEAASASEGEAAASGEGLRSGVALMEVEEAEAWPSSFAPGASTVTTSE